MNLRKNIILYYVISFLSACIFIIPIWSFFFVNYLHFSFGWALFITIFSGLISFIFEIPSGAWADRFGRKITYILGLIIILFGYSFYIWNDNIGLFLLASFFQGLGFAMTSGNMESLIHDNLIENKKEKEFSNISANSYVYIFTGRGISSLVAGFLFMLNPLFPIYFTILAYILILIVLFFIKESKYHKPEKTTNIKQIRESIRIVFQNKIIYIFLILMFLQAGLSNVYWFTYQPYLEFIGFDIGTIGIIFAIISFLSAFGSHILKKIQEKYHVITITKIILYSIFISSILFFIFDSKLGLLPIIILAITIGFVMPLGNNFLASKVPSSKKSTILSIYSFAITLGYFSFSTISGFLIDIIGLKQLYFGVLIFCLFLFLIDILYLRKVKLE